VNPFERQHLPRRSVPVDRRHAKVGVVFDVFGEFGSGGRLQAKVHLDAHRARQRLDDLDGFQPTHVGGHPLRQSRRKEHIGEVPRKAPFDARPHDFHRDLARRVAVLDAGAVDLGDRGGRHGFAEIDEQGVELHPEGRFDRRDGDAARIGRHPVLQLLELVGDLGADDVRPR
jgi:hypothetical protein